MSAITSLAPWFGGKRTMAPHIVEALGPHRIYWEPFAGSMAVLLAKPPCRMETVNDLHGDLVNLARVIQDPALGPALYRRLRRVWSSQEQFRDALDVVRSSDVDGMVGPDVDRAFHYFVASWQGMNGVAGTDAKKTNFCRRFSSTGGDPGKRWSGAVRSIPQWRRRLEQVTILSSDGIELCEKIEDRTGTVIYADPPYLAKGARYRHDFAATDHERLARALGRFQATRVVVSYYRHEDLAALYPGWRVVPIDVAKNMVNSGAAGDGGRVAAPEVLLVNDADQTPLFAGKDA